MLTLIFVAFVAMFATAGMFLSIEAKRRNDGSAARSMPGGGRSLGRGGSDSN